MLALLFCIHFDSSSTFFPPTWGIHLTSTLDTNLATTTGLGYGGRSDFTAQKVDPESIPSNDAMNLLPDGQQTPASSWWTWWTWWCLMFFLWGFGWNDLNFGSGCLKTTKALNSKFEQLIGHAYRLVRFKYKREPKIVIGTEPRFSLKESTSLSWKSKLQRHARMEHCIMIC